MEELSQTFKIHDPIPQPSSPSSLSYQPHRQFLSSYKTDCLNRLEHLPHDVQSLIISKCPTNQFLWLSEFDRLQEAREHYFGLEIKGLQLGCSHNCYLSKNPEVSPSLLSYMFENGFLGHIELSPQNQQILSLLPICLKQSISQWFTLYPASICYIKIHSAASEWKNTSLQYYPSYHLITLFSQKGSDLASIPKRTFKL